MYASFSSFWSEIDPYCFVARSPVNRYPAARDGSCRRGLLVRSSDGGGYSKVSVDRMKCNNILNFL